MKTLIGCLLFLVCAVPLNAQEKFPRAPGGPRTPLARMAGDWETQAMFWMWSNPSAPPMEATATVCARMIMGDRFLLQNVKGQLMGQPIEAIGVIGHDSATGRYEAASFDNTASSISRHVGAMNDAGHIVLHLSYQDRTGATVDRRTVRMMLSGDEWVETAHETRNGVERKVMQIRARRADWSLPSRC